jgi:hypothetical protein
MLTEVKLATVSSIAPTDSLCNQLQDALYSVIKQERFDALTVAQTVGTLEFLKWNLINCSNT